MLRALKYPIACSSFQRRTLSGAMREMSVREANQNFSQVIAAAEHGETIIITKNGTPVARISPRPPDRASDPPWRPAGRAPAKSLPSKQPTRPPAGPATEEEQSGGEGRRTLS